MAITVSDVEDLLNVLREHPEWRERVRQEILGESITQLPQTVDRIDQRLAELIVIVDRLTVTVEDHGSRLNRIEERLDGIDVRLNRIEERLDGIDVRLDGVDERLADMQARLDRMDGRIGLLEGGEFERRFHARERLLADVRRVRDVVLGEVDQLDEALATGLISREDLRRLALLDYIFQGRARCIRRLQSLEDG